MQVVEIGLGEHIEMMLTEDMSREDHCGVMEVTELFEDDKVCLSDTVQSSPQHSSFCKPTLCTRLIHEKLMVNPWVGQASLPLNPM